MGTLKRFATQSATTLTTGSETTPSAGKVWNVPRLYVCNASDTDDTVSVILKSGPNSVYLIKDATLAAHDTMILENIALVHGDMIEVASGGPYTIHCYGAIIEEDA